VKSTISYYVKKYFTILLAPIYFHLGHYSFVINLITIGYDLVDILGTYFLNFLMIGGLIFYKNHIFQIFNKLFFKNYLINKNNLPFLNFFNTFFTSVNKFISNIKNKF
jgi:hypothetical protein